LRPLSLVCDLVDVWWTCDLLDLRASDPLGLHGLENPWGPLVPRGFESHPLRYLQVRQPFFGCVTVSLTVVLPLTTHVAETLE
jgi:hypothetical protein